MDPKDRLFAELAVRLQLLTREQVATCVEHGARVSGKRASEVAVELGFISSDEAALVRAQETRVLERQQRPSAPGPLVEQRAKRSDPRSASSPPPAEPQAGTGAAKRRNPRNWEAPVHPTQGQVHVPRAATTKSPETSMRPPTPPRMSAPAPPREFADTAPGASFEFDDERPTGTHPRALHLADTAPQTLLARQQPTPRAGSAGMDAFPLAEGHEAAQARARADGSPQAPAPRGATSATVPQGFAVPPQDAAAARAAMAMGATLLGPASAVAPPSATFPGAAGGTLLQGFTAPPAAVPQAVALPVAPLPTVASPRTQPPPKAAERRPAGNVVPGESYLGKALALALRHGASDLHAHSGAPLSIRVDGQMRPLSGTSLLSAEAAERVIAEVVTDAQWAVLSRKGEVDFAYEIPGLARFRVNVYRQQRGLDAVFRIIAAKPPTLEDLGLPARLARLTDFRTGMVLCTGPTGCGKSTTLAALLYALTQSRPDHVLTIEDPVEYVYPPGPALVNQRQVRDHTSTFARALRAALREDPDVIAITELRDRDTIGLAISAAETGHLVLGTLHTGNAAQTIQRIISSFPADEQEQVRTMLAESLRAVVSQRLVPMAVGRGRVPAVELLMVTTAVSNLIREDKTHQLPSVMQTGRASGMMTLDDSLEELVRSGTVTAEAARRFAVKKERFA
jgi:twitching motility protein PilT